MTNKLMMAAASTGVALAMTSPAAAGPVELAMADYVRAKGGPDAAGRDAALREHHKRRAANGDCGDCDEYRGCGKGDCPHGAGCKDEKIACVDCEDPAESAEGAKCDPAGQQTNGGIADATSTGSRGLPKV